jgi:triacylglycerol lipase
MVTNLEDRLKGLTADMFAPGTDGIRDHSMDRYQENFERNLG